MADITIPPAALEAAARAAYHKATAANAGSVNDWDDPAAEAERRELLEIIRATCIAMLNNWPGASFVHRDWDGQRLMCLPLPQEASDE